MLKEKDLREFRPTYRYPNGTGITLQSIQNAIRNKANQYQIPVAFASEKIKSGGMLNSTVEDCLILYHPEHQKDYYNIAISIKRQGTMAFVSANDFGESKNLKKINAKSAAGSALKQGWKNAGKEGNWSPGMSLVSGAIGGAVGALRSLGGSKGKQEEENNYYGALMQILDEVIS